MIDNPATPDVDLDPVADHVELLLPVEDVPDEDDTEDPDDDVPPADDQPGEDPPTEDPVEG